MLFPRIYWLGSHQTLRYEEVPLLIEAGAEVIPSLGDPFWLRYDSNYNNENDILYPPWRISCTLPVNIVEKIRQIKFWENRGEVTSEEAELFNRWINVIFISHYPDILKNITKWYQGYIVYRVFGVGDVTTYTELMNRSNIDIDDLAANDKYVWAPILNCLDVKEDMRIIKNKLYLNAFVSKDRLGFTWEGKNSKPFITTILSYLDRNLVTREILKNFSEKFTDIPFVVLGKNSKAAAKDITDKVLGYVDDNRFFSKIAESRIFVYLGLGSNYHLHYTPIEAMSMGVPIIFLKESGLANEARNHGITNEELEKLGMCTNIQNMKGLVLKLMNDFPKLEKMSHNQSKVFGKIFSRKSALMKTHEFFRKIQPIL